MLHAASRVGPTDVHGKDKVAVLSCLDTNKFNADKVTCQKLRSIVCRGSNNAARSRDLFLQFDGPRHICNKKSPFARINGEGR